MAEIKAIASNVKKIPNHLQVDIRVPVSDIDTYIAKPLPRLFTGIVNIVVCVLGSYLIFYRFAEALRVPKDPDVKVLLVISFCLAATAIFEWLVYGSLKLNVCGYGRFAWIMSGHDSTWVCSAQTPNPPSSKHVIVTSSIPLDEDGKGQIWVTHPSGNEECIGRTSLVRDDIIVAYGEKCQYKLPPIHINLILEILEENWYEISQKRLPGDIMLLRSRDKAQLSAENTQMHNRIEKAEDFLEVMPWENALQSIGDQLQEARKIADQAKILKDELEQEKQKVEEYKTALSATQNALSEQEKTVKQKNAAYVLLAQEGREKLELVCGAYEALITFNKSVPEMLPHCVELCLDVLETLPENCPDKKIFLSLLSDLKQLKQNEQSS